MNIDALKDLMKRGEVSEVSRALDSLRDVDPKTKTRLFEIFDATIDDDFLFSTLHVLETLEHEIYVEAYLAHLEAILNRSPEWAGIMLIRIVNHAFCYRVLKELLVDSSMINLVNKARKEALKIKKDMPLLG